MSWIHKPLKLKPNPIIISKELRTPDKLLMHFKIKLLLSISDLAWKVLQLVETHTYKLKLVEVLWPYYSRPCKRLRFRCKFWCNHKKLQSDFAVKCTFFDLICSSNYEILSINDDDSVGLKHLYTEQQRLNLKNIIFKLQLRKKYNVRHYKLYQVDYFELFTVSKQYCLFINNITLFYTILVPLPPLPVTHLLT